MYMSACPQIDVTENVKRIEERVAQAALRAGRRPEEIRIMAVTKTVEPARINEAVAAGLRLLGENRVQEMLSKLEDYDPRAEVHFIGHLQTNKVRKIVDRVGMIQSVDSLHLGREIERCLVPSGRTLEVLVEVNVGSELSKSGVAPERAAELVAALAELPHLRVRGLMTIPPLEATGEETRGYFRRIRKLLVDISNQNIDNVSMDILSMGMSADYELAVEEGSTLVRIGSALFGRRPRL